MSSNYQSVKGKLTFKGEKKKHHHKKKDKKRKHNDEDEVQEPIEGWVNVETPEDLNGPIFILTNATETLSCIVFNKEINKISLSSVVEPEDTITSAILPQFIKNLKPTDVSQVFVIKRVIDSPSFTLKSAYDKYLSSDRFGIVECEKEAVGPQEEWELIFNDDGISLKNAYDKFLTIDEQNGKKIIRADSETIGFHEKFIIKCQAQNKKKKKVKVEEKPLSSQELETIKKYQSWGNGKVLTPHDLKKLKKAKKSGKVHETMLDRREKLKSDSYCK